MPPTTPAAAQAEYPLAPLAERNRKDRKEAVPSISRTARRDRGYEDYMGNQGLRLQHVIKAFHSGRGRDGLELKQPYTGNDQSQQPHSPPSSYPSSSSSSRRVFLNKEEGIAISGSDNGDAKLDEKLEVRPPSPSPSPPPRMHDSDNLTGDGVGTNTEVRGTHMHTDIQSDR